MELKYKHTWNLSKEKAIDLQIELSNKIVKDDDFQCLKLITGVDIAYSKTSDKLIAAAVTINRYTLCVVESIIVEDVERFPYISGLFSFREAPAIIKAISKLTIDPDLIICDGQGIAHPRRFGLACHIGILFDKPTIGCAKTRYIGEFVEPNIKRGSYSQLIDNGEVIGSVLRTQDNINPIFISIGHKISLKKANKIILELSPKYRLPETTRLSDQAVRRKLKELN